MKTGELCGMGSGRESSQQRRLLTIVLSGFAILMLALVGVAMAAAGDADQGQLPLGIDWIGTETASNRVDVSIGVMSKCPDAFFFENAFSRALERVNQKITLSLYYIAKSNSSSFYGATCKHGDEECLGNIHQLCVMDSLNPNKAGKRYDLGPSAAQRLWWDFIQCENYVGGVNRIGQESLVKQCIKAIGGVPDWDSDGIKECVEGKKGRELLKASIKEAVKRDIE